MTTTKTTYFLSSILTTLVICLCLNAYFQASKYLKLVCSNIKIIAFTKRNKNISDDVIKEKLFNIEGEKQVEYFSSKKIYDELKNKENLKDIMLTSSNPFSSFFVIYPRMTNSVYIEELANKIIGLKGIDEVSYDEKLVNIGESLNSFTTYYNITSKILLIFGTFIIFLKLFFRIFRKRADLFNYLYMAGQGLLSSFVGLILYFILFNKIFHVEIMRLSVDYLILSIPFSMVLTLAWER